MTYIIVFVVMGTVWIMIVLSVFDSLCAPVHKLAHHDRDGGPSSQRKDLHLQEANAIPQLDRGPYQGWGDDTPMHSHPPVPYGYDTSEYTELLLGGMWNKMLNVECSLVWLYCPRHIYPNEDHKG